MKRDYKKTARGREAERLYGDIIRLSRPVSGRPKMDLVQRAKIFSPFDALQGFDEEIQRTEEAIRKAGQQKDK